MFTHPETRHAALAWCGLPQWAVLSDAYLEHFITRNPDGFADYVAEWDASDYEFQCYISDNPDFLGLWRTRIRHVMALVDKHRELEFPTRCEWDSRARLEKAIAELPFDLKAAR